VKLTVEFDSLDEVQELESKLAKLDDLADAVEDLRQLNEELRRMLADQQKSKLASQDSAQEPQ
jgi:cell shape-determining protein MreC|tara:strand:+ start:455 stop:643 length:189 start_codon:yes stop_codon:yes gene_type:complete